MYDLRNDRLLEWSTVQKFCFSAPALQSVFATLRDEIVHPLQIERPAKSHEETVEPDDEGNVVRKMTFSGHKICMDECTSFLFGRQKSPAQKANELGSKKIKLSPWTVLIRKQKETV